MSNHDMTFSDKQEIILETISYLRKSTVGKRLYSTVVERESAPFLVQWANRKGIASVKDGAVVRRQNWEKRDADEVWSAIRDAIKGKLSPSHPIEIRIAEFGKEDKSGRLVARIQDLDRECTSLRLKAKDAEARYDTLERTVLVRQYQENYEMANLKTLRQDRDNLRIELTAKENLLNKVQLRVDSLEHERNQLRKNAGATEVVEGAKRRIIEPKIAILVDVSDDDLLQQYQELAKVAIAELLSKFDKSPRPKDVVLVFHTFNADVERFVDSSVPFRHNDGNFVFAAYVQNPQTRIQLFEEVSALMHPFHPRVFIVSGGTLRQTDVTRTGKVVKIDRRQDDIAITKRLFRAIGARRIQYNVVDEGYEEVRVVRVTNE